MTAATEYTPISYNLVGASAATGLAPTKIRTLIRSNRLAARREGKDIVIEHDALVSLVKSLPEDGAA